MGIFYIIKTSQFPSKEPSTTASSPFSFQTYVPVADQPSQTPPFNIIYSTPTISQSYTHVAPMKSKCQYTNLTTLYLIPLLYRSDTVCGTIMWLGSDVYLWCHTFPFISVSFLYVFLCVTLCLITLPHILFVTHRV
jgi:hypothetical protein